MTEEHSARIEDYQILWLRRKQINISDAIRQALTIYIRYRRGLKVLNGYNDAINTVIYDDMKSEKIKYTMRLHLDQLEWLREEGRNGSEEIRRALDAYIIWRDMGFKTTVRHSLYRHACSQRAYIRKDQHEWLVEHGVVSELILKALEAYAARSTTELYTQVKSAYVPDGRRADISVKVRTPQKYRKISIIDAIDVFMIYNYLA